MDAAHPGTAHTGSAGSDFLLSAASNTASSLPSALATAQESSPSRSWLGMIGGLALVMVRLVPALLYWAATFTSITLPTLLFKLFSTSLTFTMNFTTLYSIHGQLLWSRLINSRMLITLAFGSLVSWIVRYRYLNMYTRLPQEPQRKEPHIDLFPNTQDEDSKPGLANYLDEFLSAIKVFGYLERPVFHELTRTMQTRKLIAGETLLLEEEKGFCLVVDGLVQIFVKSSRDSDPTLKASWMGGSGQLFEDEEDQLGGEHQGYQLLTEVKNGAPMSSLFSILSLFTEDVKLRHQSDAEERGDSSSSNVGFPSVTPDSFPATPHGANGRSSPPPKNHIRQTSVGVMGNGMSTVPPMSLEPALKVDGYDSANARDKPYDSSKPRKRKSVHPDIVARATVDTTIAIIPATAFHRLTRVYPKATAHIVQVILTRLQRVTLATAHSYLGLTSEVLQTERHMNRYTNYDLPNHLRGAALERLKDKFTAEKERLSSIEEGMKGIALHNPGAARRRSSSSSLRRDALNQAMLSAAHERFPAGSLNGGRTGVDPGDLLTNIQMSRFGASGQGHSQVLSHDSESAPLSPAEGLSMTSPLGQRELNPFALSAAHNNIRNQRQESLDEDGVFRESILECIITAVGLTNTKDAIRKPSTSVEHSPRMVSYDSQRQKATFANAFGFMDPYEGSGDGDAESISSVSAYGGVPFNPRKLTSDMRDELEIVYFPKDAVLVEEGERNPGLYYVIDGFLDVSVGSAEKDVETIPSMNGTVSHHTDDLLPPLRRVATGVRRSDLRSTSRGSKKPQARKSLYLIKPGGLAGYIGTVSSYRSFIDVRAKTDVYVGFLPRVSLERLVEKYPVILLTMAKRLTSLLPKLILHIDFALEWIQVDAGHIIYHQGDESDSIYIVLNGRLRALLENDDGAMRVVAEYGQGESVGELEVMTESVRPATLHAIRDTELAKFPRSLFNSLALEHPGITMKVSKIIAQRMRALIEDPLLDQGKEKAHISATKNGSSTMNLRTTAILPVTAGVPVVDFGSRLLSALTQIGVVNGVTSLNQAAILNHLGRHAFSRMGKLKLSQYLADLEERYGMLLYIADTNVNSPWTQTCITQADCILLVGLAEESPSIGEYERFLLGMKTTARKELVLLHVERYSPPGLTRKWLRHRVWINGGHHHIQMALRSDSQPVSPQIKRFGTALKQRVQVLQAEIQKYTSRRVRQTPLYSAETPFKGDFHRLARRLCGKSVGLVLGGGGARGISQMGVIRALEEAGIPIDIVGGTSIGAFVGALYARDADIVPMYGRAKKFAGRMGSMWRFALDLTYPSASYTTGHEFNRGIFKTFDNSQIEDFWLKFYCNTTNISRSRAEFHSSGYVWRYVRASMSLAGLIPPLCDEGNMLVDGGYVDNLTVAHMKSLGADVVFAIDVGSLDDNQPQTFGDSLSGAWALFNRWNPFSSHPNPPTLSEIQAKLAYVSSFDALERAKKTPGCLYMRPPVDAYGTLDFGKFDEIYQLGYEYGKEYLGKLRDQGLLPVMEETEEKRNLRRTMAPRRASV